MTCKNCHNTLIDSSSFCNSCGAKIIRNRLTIKNLFESFSEQFLNYDNKFFQTFINLFRKPEAVIGSYVDGTRKKYVNVVSYFAIAITVSGLLLFIMNKFFPGMMDFSIMTAPGQEEFQKKNTAFVQEYQSILMMLYVPGYALMAKLAFIGIKKFNYTELVVVFMYIQAQISIASAFIIIIAAFFGITYGAMGLILIPLMILYSAYCLKRIYQLTLSEIILRTLLFLVILGVAFVIFSIILAVIMYLNGDMEAMMEAQKQAIEARKAKGN